MHSLVEGGWVERYIILLVLELTLIQLCVVSHMEQVSACEKWFLLSSESKFAVLLKTMYHGKNLVKGFVANIPWQHRFVKDQNMED
jgi:hypothetical protein